MNKGLTLEGLEDNINKELKQLREFIQEQVALDDSKFEVLAKFTEDQLTLNKTVNGFMKESVKGAKLLEDLSKIVADMDDRISTLEITNKTGVEG